MRADSGELTLIVETADGTWVRQIQAASPLRNDIEPGYAAEEATRSAAARWGLPDFIFRPALSAKGRGVVEVGDALLIAGDLAACVQVKMRTSPSDNDHRERLWLDKKIDEARRQALGSLRRMQQLGTLLLVNERGREVAIDTARPSWTSVVILDHPGVQDYVPKTSSSLVVLRRDWEFLFSQLKSTYVVLQYLHHISRDSVRTPLGDEPVRYYEVAQASLTKEPDPLDQRLVAPGAGRSVPIFPLAPAGSGEIVRWVLEDIATQPLPDSLDPSALLTILAAVDSTPLAFREDLGNSGVGSRS